MGRTVLITGASGALGPHVLAELLRDGGNGHIVVLLRSGASAWSRRVESVRLAVLELMGSTSGGRVEGVERLHPMAADIRRDDLGLTSRDRRRLMERVDVVVHAAASTRFTAPVAELRDVNVEGTRRVVDLARRCSRLQQFLFVSTTCVAGTRTGVIAERIEEASTGFVNRYERTKWEAEWLVATSSLPVRIARLSTCVGGEQQGYVHRFGAIHQSMRWLVRGLVPMLPAEASSRVDLVATDVAAQWIAHAVACPVGDLNVCHVAAGKHAVPIDELLDAAVGHLRITVPEWKRGQIEAPLIVDAGTFELFERSVVQSGDALLRRVLEDARSFFPTLLYPKVYETTAAERLWGGPLPLSDWRATLGKVLDFGCTRHWRVHRRSREYADA